MPVPRWPEGYPCRRFHGGGDVRHLVRPLPPRSTRAAEMLASQWFGAIMVRDGMPDAVEEAAGIMLQTAKAMAERSGFSLLVAYWRRIQNLESSGPFAGSVAESPSDMIAAAKSWRDVRIAQAAFDRWFRPDVFGLARIVQIERCTQYLNAIIWDAAGALDDPEDRPMTPERVSDLAIFAMKLHTIAGVEMSSAPLSEAVGSSEVAG